MMLVPKWCPKCEEVVNNLTDQLKTTLLQGLSFLFVVMILCGCEQRWEGFFYPKGTGGDVIRSSVFKTKNECLDWCIQQKMHFPDSDAVDYECGKNCRLGEIGLFICDETVDY